MITAKTTVREIEAMQPHEVWEEFIGEYSVAHTIDEAMMDYLNACTALETMPPKAMRALHNRLMEHIEFEVRERGI